MVFKIHPRTLLKGFFMQRYSESSVHFFSHFFMSQSLELLLFSPTPWTWGAKFSVPSQPLHVFDLQNISPQSIRNIVSTVFCPVVCKKLHTGTFMLVNIMLNFKPPFSCFIFWAHSASAFSGKNKKSGKRGENWDCLFNLVLERRQHITQMKQPTQIIHQVHWFCAALILCRANFWHPPARSSACRAEHAPKLWFFIVFFSTPLSLKGGADP